MPPILIFISHIYKTINLKVLSICIHIIWGKIIKPGSRISKDSSTHYGSNYRSYHIYLHTPSKLNSYEILFYLFSNFSTLALYEWGFGST